MAGPVNASGKAPRAAVAGVLAAFALAGAVVVFAQALKIPDFRRSPPPVAPGPRPGEPCDNCGVIRSIREVESQRPVAVPKNLQNEPFDRGSMASEVRVGAVIALPLGGGGNPYVGGVGTPEMRERFTETTYEIIIRLDNGNFTMVQRSDGSSFNVGDRVRVRGIQLELLAS